MKIRYFVNDKNDMKDTRERQEEAYQRRLERVLSKFDYLVRYPVGFSYDKNNNTFFMNGMKKQVSISLETVECLIRDMEGKK